MTRAGLSVVEAEQAARLNITVEEYRSRLSDATCCVEHGRMSRVCEFLCHCQSCHDEGKRCYTEV